MLGNYSIILILISFSSLVFSIQKTEEFYREEFRKFVITFGKTYETPKEESLRFKIWRLNAEFIETHNALATLGQKTFWVKMNKFGDMVMFDYSNHMDIKIVFLVYLNLRL
jgi:hypothetical protein